MTYVVKHKDTGVVLGKASDVESLGELVMDLYFDDGIWPHEIRVEGDEDEPQQPLS